MTSVLVLGVGGMLGSVVYEFLSAQDLDVYGTTREKDAVTDRVLFFEVGDELPKQCDYVINCVGIIKPYCKDDDPVGTENAIRVNALFPHELAKMHPKVIQIATDCVYSGDKGGYDEDALHDALDVYGKSESLGEPLSVLNIRCSIIGREQKGKLNLLEWFLAQEGKTYGFTHHKWNGVTTLRFAKLCKEIITNDAFDRLLKESHVHHFVPRDVLNKFELLTLFKDVFKKEITIEQTDAITAPVDRTLSTKFSSLHELLPAISIEDDVRELKTFIE